MDQPDRTAATRLEEESRESEVALPESSEERKERHHIRRQILNALNVDAERLDPKEIEAARARLRER